MLGQGVCGFVQDEGCGEWYGVRVLWSLRDAGVSLR